MASPSHRAIQEMLFSPLSPVLAGTKPLLLGECCAIIITVICRYGGIGRHKGLKILRKKFRTGSSPVSGTKPNRECRKHPRFGFFVMHNVLRPFRAKDLKKELPIR